MKYLKEDGSLDIERINRLPLEEYIKELESLTQEQYKDYSSKLPLYESNIPVRAIDVNSTMEEDVKRNGLIDAEDFLNNMLNDM